MNKKQKILMVVIILILEIVLLGGALFKSRDYYEPFNLDDLSKDKRVYIAILLLGVGGYFLFSGRKNE